MAIKINFKSKAKKISLFFKSMPHLKKYLLFAILMTVIFTVINFPYNSLIIQNISKLNSRAFQIDEIRGMDFSLIRDSTIDLVKINFSNGGECNLNNIIFAPSINPIGIMNKNYQAELEVKVIKYETEKIALTSSANLDLDISLGKTGVPMDGFLNIIAKNTMLFLEDISIPTPMGDFPLEVKQLEIKKIDLNLKFNKDKAVIQRANCSGKDLKVDVSGDIVLKNIYGNSILNLKVFIDEKSSILDKYRGLIASVVKEKKIGLKVEGTISRPRITLIK